jgi:hypothetical protein
MTDQPAVQRGAAEDASDTPLTQTEVDASRRPPSDPSDPQPSDVRDVEEAHGGSMAPGLVDETGHPIAEPPAGTQPT